MRRVFRLCSTLFSQSYAAPDHVYRGDACPCGSLFPVLDVIGRTDDILSFPTPQGRIVQILPLAIATVAEDTPGVYSCQIIQTYLLKLKVRLAVKDTAQEQFVWEVLQARLVIYLAQQGIASVSVEKALEPPQLHPKSGKFRQVWSEI